MVHTRYAISIGFFANSLLKFDLAQTAQYWTNLGIFGIIRVYIGIYGYKGSLQKEDGKSAGIANEIPLPAKALVLVWM